MRSVEEEELSIVRCRSLDLLLERRETANTEWRLRAFLDLCLPFSSPRGLHKFLVFYFTIEMELQKLKFQKRLFNVGFLKLEGHLRPRGNGTHIRTMYGVFAGIVGVLVNLVGSILALMPRGNNLHRVEGSLTPFWGGWRLLPDQDGTPNNY